MFLIIPIYIYIFVQSTLKGPGPVVVWLHCTIFFIKYQTLDIEFPVI